MCTVASACDGREPSDAGRHGVIYSPLPALLQRQFPVEGHVPNDRLDWPITANVLILSVSSWHRCLRRKETVLGTGMV